MSATTQGLWTVTDHLCRECLGRILYRVDGAAAGTHQCSNCAADAAGAIEALCSCGLRLKDGKDMGFRCLPNPKRGPDFPAEIVVTRKAGAKEEAFTTVQSALPLRVYKPVMVPE